MKNQYVGDINDFRKYGLLRIIQKTCDIGILVNWMLTPNDTRTDGKNTDYLSTPEKWRSFDPDLFDIIRTLLPESQQADVALIEQSNTLPNTRFFSEIVPDDRDKRLAWFDRFLQLAVNSKFVFIDPDNGIEIKSKPMGRKDSSKFLYWDEVEKIWEMGNSLLIYQHYPHIKHERFNAQLVEDVRRKTASSQIEIFETPHVLFLMIVQANHASQISIEKITQEVNRSWSDQFKMHGLSAT